MLAAALLTASDPQILLAALSADELIAEILDKHEARYWHHFNEQLGAGLHPDDQRRLVAVAALLGAGTEADAGRLVRLVPGFADASDERVRAVARWLAGLYGSGGLDTRPAVTPIEPDLLAEVLVAREMTARPDLLDAALDAAAEDQLSRALVVLSRAVAGRDQFADVARTALDERLQGMVRRFVARSPWNQELLAALRSALRTVRPAFGAAAAIDELPERSTALAPLAADLDQLMVAATRELAGHDPEPYLPHLAAALNNLSSRLSDLGRLADALAASQEAVDIRRTLAQADPDRHLPGLAGSLNNVAIRLGDLGRPTEALPLIQEAADIRRTLAQANPDRHLPDLAISLNNLAVQLAAVGRPADAYTASREAVDLRRTLADANSDRHLPGLAMSLSTLANRLGDLGRFAEALPLIQEAVDIRRTLAQANPDRHLPDLALALNNLAGGLSDLGRHADALPLVQEAVTHHRSLAEVNPDRYLPDLAMSLSNLAVHLSDLGQFADALPVTQEAVALYRTLTDADPDRHLPDLARSLSNLAVYLSELGRHADALPLSQEAIDIRRTLAGANPDRHLPDLAASLNNLSNRLGSLGRSADALSASQEAVDIRRALAQVNPDRHLSDLAGALNNLALHLNAAGRSADALSAGQEAVDTLRGPARANPGRDLPDLALALHNLAVHLSSRDRRADGARLFEEALADHRDPWPTAVLLLGRARWRHGDGDRVPALRDAWTAMRHLDAVGDPMRRGQARTLLRSFREQDPAAFDSAWRQVAGGDLPVWLRHPQSDPALIEALVGWLNQETLGDSQAVLVARRDAFLTDEAEAAMEHLIDGNPGADVITRYLDALRRARSDGVDAAYDMLRAARDREVLWQQLVGWLETPDWEASRSVLEQHAETLLTDEVEALLTGAAERGGDPPDLVTHLGLLGLCRSDGVETAYELIGDVRRLQTEAQQAGEGDPHRALALARLLAAGQPDDGDAQFGHAVAAVTAGRIEEAERAMLRCAEALAWWERTARARRLTGLAAERPDLAEAYERLRVALLAPTDGPHS